MKWAMTCLGIFVISLIVYMFLWMGVSAGQLLFLAYLMMPVGLLMGVFLILAIVFFVIKK